MIRRLRVEWPEPEPFTAREGRPIRWLAVSDGKPSDVRLRKFVHELQVFAALQGCVVLLLTSDARRD